MDRPSIRCLDLPSKAVKLALADLLEQEEGFWILDEDLGGPELVLIVVHPDRVEEVDHPVARRPGPLGVRLFRQDGVPSEKLLEKSSVGVPCPPHPNVLLQSEVPNLRGNAMDPHHASPC
jgi:hypothetical protein